LLIIVFINIYFYIIFCSIESKKFKFSFFTSSIISGTIIICYKFIIYFFYKFKVIIYILITHFIHLLSAVYCLLNYSVNGIVRSIGIEPI